MVRLSEIRMTIGDTKENLSGIFNATKIKVLLRDEDGVNHTFDVDVKIDPYAKNYIQELDQIIFPVEGWQGNLKGKMINISLSSDKLANSTCKIELDIYFDQEKVTYYDNGEFHPGDQLR